MFSIFINSLKRLYVLGKVNTDRLEQLLTDSKITTEEYNFIVGEAE